MDDTFFFVLFDTRIEVSFVRMGNLFTTPVHARTPHIRLHDNELMSPSGTIATNTANYHSGDGLGPSLPPTWRADVALNTPLGIVIEGGNISEWQCSKSDLMRLVQLPVRDIRALTYPFQPQTTAISLDVRGAAVIVRLKQANVVVTSHRVVFLLPQTDPTAVALARQQLSGLVRAVADCESHRAKAASEDHPTSPTARTPRGSAPESSSQPSPAQHALEVCAVVLPVRYD